MIKTIDLGENQKGIALAEFGTGDIMFHHIASEDIKFGLAFIQTEPRAIGATTQEFIGMTTDQLPHIGVIFNFTKPESVTAVIHSLIELQKRMFDGQGK